MVKNSLKIKEISLSERMELKKSGSQDELIVVYKIDQTLNPDQKYAVFTQAPGRYDLFDYLLILSGDIMVKKVDVIKYRSEHGGEIASKKWLSQFENYSTGMLKYGTDISAISGATLSAKSITEDIPKVLEQVKSVLGN